MSLIGFRPSPSSSHGCSLAAFPRQIARESSAASSPNHPRQNTSQAHPHSLAKLSSTQARSNVQAKPTSSHVLLQVLVVAVIRQVAHVKPVLPLADFGVSLGLLGRRVHRSTRRLFPLVSRSTVSSSPVQSGRGYVSAMSPVPVPVSIPVSRRRTRTGVRS